MNEKKNEVMEEVISGAIVRRYFQKLEDNLAIDVAIVGAGPSGLVAAHDLAKAGLKVAMYESKLAPGGGTWGGGMLMNEVTVQNDAAEILREFGITTVPYDDKYHTVDSVEMASGLIFGARKAGATIFNTVKVEDIVMHDGIVSGVVISALVYAGLASVSTLLLGWLPGLLGKIPLLQIGLPAVLSIYFDVFTSLMQAFIFAMLTMLYIGNAVKTD